MRDMRHKHERDKEHELNRFWNAVAAGEPEPHDVALDAEEMALVHDLHRRGTAVVAGPPASSAWPAVLARISAAQAIPAPGDWENRHPVATPFIAPNGRVHIAMAPSRPQSWALGHLATAVLIALTLVTGLFTFGPLRPRSERDLVGVPAVIESTAPARGQLQFLWESPGGPEPLDSPYGLGVDAAGNVWVADGKRSTFTIIAADGAYLETWGTPGTGEGEFNFTGSYGGQETFRYGDVAFDMAGNIYVADTGNHRIQKFAPDRRFLRAWGAEGSNDGEFKIPSAIAVDATGNVFVNDESRQDVQKFDGEGRFLGAIGGAGSGAGKLNTSTGVAVDRNGEVLVADFWNNRIARFTPDGTFLAARGSYGSAEGEISGPIDVAVDRLGYVYVVEMDNYRIQVFAPDGGFVASAGGLGQEPGQFYGPRGIAVSDTGIVFVSDDVKDVVQAFRLSLPTGASLMP